jgi:chromate reductase, NAD(P)H dehydrogenase (quinone)
MAGKIKILGFAGSLRKGSYNKALLRAALEMVPQDAEIETFDLAGIPPYNQDLDNDMPQIVLDFKAKIRAADSILIVTPEYNFSIPGVLKNAIDWASRPYGDNAFAGKPAAIMGASIGLFGTARAQYHLRQSFVNLGINALIAPEVMVPAAADKFDKDGRLTDDTTRQMVKKLLESLVAWTLKLK